MNFFASDKLTILLLYYIHRTMLFSVDQLIRKSKKCLKNIKVKLKK